jgi:predicted Rossmann fold nucleotide-binding protein DprA/Smf involved in DNA uptake
MALGVDGIVACAALVENAPTIGVLGTGIDIIYPSKHRKIYEELVEKGAVISEYAPGVRGSFYTFPTRNRIISGLSQATFVVEAGMDSGAMITAKDALVQGRELFALPGNIGSENSKGTNELIRQGAHAVFSADDILFRFMPLYSHKIDASAVRKGPPQYDAEVLRQYGILPDSYENSEFEPIQNEPGVIKPRKEKAPKKSQTAKEVAKKADDLAEERKKDNTAKIYETLDPKLRAVYDAIPEYEAVSVDGIKADGVSVGEIIAALTLLELQGLIKGMPGGVYARA